MRNDGIRVGAPEVIGGKALKDLVRELIGGLDSQVQGGGIGHAGSVQVGRVDAFLLGQSLNLLGCAVHQHHADVQRTQHGDIQQDVGEVLVRDDDSIHGNNEGL